MKIFATLPSGKKVFHGELDRGTFKRIVPHHYVRFSDRSFCLNASVVPELAKRQCHTLEFVWLKKNVKEVYRLTFADAVKKYLPVKNEYGEENLRIPIEDCWLLNRIETRADPEVTRAPMTVEAQAAPEKPKAEAQTLF